MKGRALGCGVSRKSMDPPACVLFPEPRHRRKAGPATTRAALLCTWMRQYLEFLRSGLIQRARPPAPAGTRMRPCVRTCFDYSGVGPGRVCVCGPGSPLICLWAFAGFFLSSFRAALRQLSIFFSASFHVSVCVSARFGDCSFGGKYWITGESAKRTADESSEFPFSHIILLGHFGS